MFLRDAEQIDSGTTAQEAFLANDDLGVGHVARVMYSLFVMYLYRTQLIACRP